MMKKTLCVFVVLALIAQICARPSDKDDAEKTAKHAEKAVKEGQAKAGEANEKGQAEAKVQADKAEKASDNLNDKGKEAAEALRKHAHGLHGGNGAESKRQQNDHKMSAVIREAEQAGEKLIESGTNIFAGFLDKMGL